MSIKVVASVEKGYSIFSTGEPIKNPGSDFQQFEVVGLGKRVTFVDNDFHLLIAAEDNGQLPKFSNFNSFGPRTVQLQIEQPGNILKDGRALIQGMDFRIGKKTIQNGIDFKVRKNGK